MDLLQIALVFLILLLAVLLSILGVQVLFILRDLRKSLDKFDAIITEAQTVAASLEGPVKVAGEMAQVVETGVNVVKKIVENRPAKRLFKKR